VQLAFYSRSNSPFVVIHQLDATQFSQLRRRC